MPQAAVALIAAVGVPGLVTASGGLTLAGSLLSAGIGLGGLVIANTVLGGQSQQRPTPQDVKGVARASVTSRSRHYGRTRVGGSLVFMETTGGDLYQIFALGEGEFDAIEEIYIDDNAVSLNASGYVTDDPYNSNSVQVVTRIGSTSQSAFAQVTSAFPGLWGSAHQLKGIACGLVVAKSVEQERFNSVYPNRYPVLNAVIRGASPYDPRSQTSAWTQNLALCARDYIRSDDGARVAAEHVDNASFETAADVCDETVTLKAGGTIKRYHGALSYAFDEDPVSVLTRFADAMDGRFYLTPEGKIGLSAGKWVSPSVTLTDDHVLEYDLEDGAGPHRSANEVIVKYTQVDAAYSEATADPWRNEDAISATGDVRSLSVERYEVQHHNHARRLAKIIEHRSNPRWVGTIRTTLYGLMAFDQRWIRVEIGDLDIDENFEVTSWALDRSNMTVVIGISSFSYAAYGFDAATEEGDAPAAPETTTQTSVPTPTGVTLIFTQEVLSSVTTTDTNTVYNNASEQNDEYSTTTTTTIRNYTLIVGFNAPASAGLRTEVQYRALGGAWQSLLVQSSSATSVQSPTVARGQTYEARVRHVGYGRTSGWVAASPATVSIPAV